MSKHPVDRSCLFPVAHSCLLAFSAVFFRAIDCLADQSKQQDITAGKRYQNVRSEKTS